MPPIHKFHPARNSSVLPCAHSSAPCFEHNVLRNNPKRPGTTAAATKRLSILKLLEYNATSSQCLLLSLLPIELLHNILHYLSPSDRIAIALTCKALYSTLGTTEFSSIKKRDKIETITFLTNLHRDFPSHLLCRHCKMLHNPSTITLPQNKLRRRGLPHACLAYLQAPGEGQDRSILYWLSDEHLRFAVSKQICASTLCCSGSINLGETLPNISALHSTFFNFKVEPVYTRGNLIVQSTYEIVFSTRPVPMPIFWPEAYLRTLLSHFDIRCCVHCSTSQNIDEIVCVLYHDGGRQNSEASSECVRLENADFDDGCGHHFHDCECTTEYKVEKIRSIQPGAFPRVVKVTVWQWLGNRKNDVALKQRGMLRYAYQDALLDRKDGEVDWGQG